MPRTRKRGRPPIKNKKLTKSFSLHENVVKMLHDLKGRMEANEGHSIPLSNIVEDIILTAAGGREKIMMLQGRSRELKTQLFNLPAGSDKAPARGRPQSEIVR